MIGAIKEDLARPQQGVVTFIPERPAKRLFTEDIVMRQWSQAAEQSLVSTRWRDLITFGTLRVSSVTRAWDQDSSPQGKAKADKAVIKLPLTPMYKIHGFGPHKNFPYEDWHCSLLGSGGVGKALLLVLVSFYASKGRLSEVRQLLHLWCTAARLTKLHWATHIENLGSWSNVVEMCSKDMIRTWAELCGLSEIQGKTKLHMSCHVALSARRFGPPLSAIIETQECDDKNWHENAGHTNCHTLPLQTARKYAITAGHVHIAPGS
ncbi:hypothetical protein K470DRAFT_289276 [Piedraia hortae CBS 480.64]|uniref:Uncharacterized protein n=1 Tax=Piedraia hortae CBS 480.64 TaxID=1314780 RepID=A0A6A7C7R9_9PEZI|nr:hypothetical protein K470DRAFT_289276 [Piedraia hortae CBS 480.64]